MTPLGPPPPEVPACADLDRLPPKFRQDVTRLLIRLNQRGFDPVVRETERSAARWRYLWGFGREYDDDRGVVTHASAADLTWHFFCLACDIVSRKHQDDATSAGGAEFRLALGEEAKALGLTWGGDWNTPDWPLGDWPHVQPGPPMRRAPTPLAQQVVDEHGLEALWRLVGAA